MDITTKQTLKISAGRQNTSLSFCEWSTEQGARLAGMGKESVLTVSDWEAREILELKFSQSEMQAMICRGINNLPTYPTEDAKKFLQDLVEVANSKLGEYVSHELEESRKSEGLA